jgi:hypothetical protein
MYEPMYRKMLQEDVQESDLRYTGRANPPITRAVQGMDRVKPEREKPRGFPLS